MTECVAKNKSSSTQEKNASSRSASDNASNISLQGSTRPDSSVSQHSHFIDQPPPLSHAATQPLWSQQWETEYDQHERLQAKIRSETRASELELPATLTGQRPPRARRYTTSSLLHMDDFHMRPHMHLPKLDMHIPHPQLHLHVPTMSNVHMPMHIPAFGEVITHLLAPNSYNATSPTANHLDTHTYTDMHTQGFSYDSMPGAAAMQSEEEVDRPHQRRGSKRSDKPEGEGKGKGKVERIDSLHVRFQKRHAEGEHDEKEDQGEDRDAEYQEDRNEMDEQDNKRRGGNQIPCDDGGPLCREAEIEKWKVAKNSKAVGQSS